MNKPAQPDTSFETLGTVLERSPERSSVWRAVFKGSKRTFDICGCVILLPMLLFFAIGLLLLNPFLNKGPLFFVQKRMGRGCKPFQIVKFRTMTAASKIERSADCPLEKDRITRLGRFLRKTRIDELPQVFNILNGDMSLIGPRPDFYDHAVQFLKTIPGYRERHTILPGISGLAQTELGYAEGSEATRLKVKADLHYISNIGFLMDGKIVIHTFSVILRGAGL